MSARSAAASRAQAGEEPFSRASTMLRRLTWIRMVPVEPPDSQEPAGESDAGRRQACSGPQHAPSQAAHARTLAASGLKRLAGEVSLQPTPRSWPLGTLQREPGSITSGGWLQGEAEPGGLPAPPAGLARGGGRGAGSRQRVACPSPWTLGCGRWAAACPQPAPGGTLPATAAAPAAPACFRLVAGLDRQQRRGAAAHPPAAAAARHVSQRTVATLLQLCILPTHGLQRLLVAHTTLADDSSPQLHRLPDRLSTPPAPARAAILHVRMTALL